MEGNNGELKEAESISESLEILAMVRED